MNGYTRAQVIGFLTLVIIFLIILFVGIKLVSYLNNDEPKEVLQNVDVKKEDFTLRLNGDFLIYLGEMEDYKELGAKAYDDGKNISDRIAISYFKDGRQVSKIDTESSGYYTVTDYIVTDYYIWNDARFGQEYWCRVGHNCEFVSTTVCIP